MRTKQINLWFYLNNAEADVVTNLELSREMLSEYHLHVSSMHPTIYIYHNFFVDFVQQKLAKDLNKDELQVDQAFYDFVQILQRVNEEVMQGDASRKEERI